eukprot:PhM_4_TR11616/c1_g1_i7/m.9737
MSPHTTPPLSAKADGSSTRKLGRVGVLCSIDIPSGVTDIKMTADYEIITVQICNAFVSSLYIPPTSKANIGDIFSGIMNSSPETSVIGGDFNARHHVWEGINGCTSRRGQQLVDWLFHHQEWTSVIPTDTPVTSRKGGTTPDNILAKSFGR